MNLYILRHAIAAKRDDKKFPDDSKRPLTEEGADKMRQIARGMFEWGVELDVILSSPYERARQTAAIVARVLPVKGGVKYTTHLTSEGEPMQLIAEIEESYRECESIMLVGHESYLSRLISVLICGGPHAGLLLKKGGLAKLHIEQLRYGACGTLEWLLTPRQLCKMAE
jgi:phosphohistidine phosphatase